jgi:predicted DNA-binding transcriptional regulator YafY
MITKNPVIRFIPIDKCLQSERGMTLGAIYNKVSSFLEARGLPTVAYSTVCDDIQLIPILYKDVDIIKEKTDEPNVLRYRYSDPEFSIYKTTLNDDQLAQLRSTLEVFLAVSGMPQLEWMEDLIDVMEKKLGAITSGKNAMSFDYNPFYLGRQYIEPLFRAIMHERVLNIEYRTFEGTDLKDEFHPYHLRQWNNRWFIIGFNPQWPKKHHVFSLDRITKITETNKEYINTKENWDEYFDDRIGVTKLAGRSVTNIKLRITDKREVFYIQTKPLHPSQKPIRQQEKGYETSIRVEHNPELEKLLFSYGDHIKVLEPFSLRKQFADRVYKLYKLYERDIKKLKLDDVQKVSVKSVTQSSEVEDVSHQKE